MWQCILESGRGSNRGITLIDRHLTFIFTKAGNTASCKYTVQNGRWGLKMFQKLLEIMPKSQAKTYLMISLYET